MKQKNRNESGQSIVILAFALVVLMGIMAVAIDGGRIYTMRRDAQNAADAAALQGARALCRDEDFEAKALEVAGTNGFAGAGVVEVNNPPVRSDSPSINGDQVEVVITGSIGGGFIAPVIYGDDITTQVLAVGDCLRGELSGSGSAIFAGAQCSGREARVNGSNVTIIGGVHSNGEVQISGGGGGNVVTGTVTHGGDASGNNVNNNTTLFPPDDNPRQINTLDYPVSLSYSDFRPGPAPGFEDDGWAYVAMTNTVPTDYHYFNVQVTKSLLEGAGLMTGNILQPGVYVSSVGFSFSGAGGSGIYGDGVTFVTLGEIDISGNGSYMRPYFEGLLLLTDGLGNPCASAAAINLTGSAVNWGGIVFAPNGNVTFAFSDNSTFYGSIIAGTVDVTGSAVQIIYDPSYLPPDPDTIELGQ